MTFLWRARATTPRFTLGMFCLLDQAYGSMRRTAGVSDSCTSSAERR